jgi:hypothetical protein
MRINMRDLFFSVRSRTPEFQLPPANCLYLFSEETSREPCSQGRSARMIIEAHMLYFEFIPPRFIPRV